jgi:hypothetical protein
MLSTRQYRTVFNRVAANHGIDWVGTWTDDVLGRGYTSEGEPLRTVTHSIGHNDPESVARFIRELRASVGTEHDIRLTSYYIKATCEIHEDLWHKKELADGD